MANLTKAIKNIRKALESNNSDTIEVEIKQSDLELILDAAWRYTKARKMIEELKDPVEEVSNLFFYE